MIKMERVKGKGIRILVNGKRLYALYELHKFIGKDRIEISERHIKDSNKVQIIDEFGDGIWFVTKPKLGGVSVCGRHLKRLFNGIPTTLYWRRVKREKKAKA